MLPQKGTPPKNAAKNYISAQKAVILKFQLRGHHVMVVKQIGVDIEGGMENSFTSINIHSHTYIPRTTKKLSDRILEEHIDRTILVMSFGINLQITPLFNLFLLLTTYTY